MMKVIIAGSRLANEHQVRYAIDQCSWIGLASTIVSGGAKGADEFGERWAHEHDVNVQRVVPKWHKFGRRAGPIRNRTMAELADGLIAVWDGTSRGTRSMIEEARSLGLRILVYRVDSGTLDEHSPSGELEKLWEQVEERAALNEFGNNMSRREAEREAGRYAATIRPETTGCKQFDLA